MSKQIVMGFLLISALLLFSAAPLIDASASIPTNTTLTQPHNPMAGTTTVVMFGGTLGLNYSPKNVTIRQGDTVEWQGSFATHPLVSDSGLWTTVNTGTTFSYTFNQPGVYHFHCFFHGSLGMVGMVVTVEPLFLPVVES
jgi:plastocyanin